MTADVRDAEIQIRMEFVVWPTLRLTPSQLRRLLNLPQEVCDRALRSLVTSGFLCALDGKVARIGLEHHLCHQASESSQMNPDDLDEELDETPIGSRPDHDPSIGPAGLVDGHAMPLR